MECAPLKLAVICTEKKPVPSVSGGAVETLVDLLIDNNERRKQVDLDVYSMEHSDAARLSRRLSNTHFYYINTRSPLNHLYHFFNRLLNKCRIHQCRSVYLTRVVKELKKHRYDWIIVENRPFFVKTIKKRCHDRTRVALHLHNDVLCRENRYASRVIRDCDKILSVSKYIHHRVTEAAFHEIDRKKSVVLYNRIDISKFRSPSHRRNNKLREKFGISLEKNIVLYYGRIKEQKGVWELVRAFERALEKNPDLYLFLFGEIAEPSYKKRLDTALRHLPDPSFSIAEYVDHDRVPEYLDSADIIVLPSLWGEAFGLTIAESAAMGKPVVSLNIGAIPELLGDGCGLLVDNDELLIERLSEAILRLAADRELREALAANARQKAVSQFSSDGYLTDLIAKLESSQD
ncbi:glycosyltransferase family 1 protein [Sporolactobacillus sp. THM7-7]|nr:glycosyltransferase family 1 protein [Sporolactobacillus sp. THM7-7]